MTSREERNLQKVVNDYFEEDQQKKSLEKQLESKKIFIKAKLSEMGQDLYETETCKAVISYQNRTSMDEEKLIEIIKENIPEEDRNCVIKNKEYVDYEILESLIYNGKINAEKLEPAQTVKTIVQLKVSAKKQVKGQEDE